ncbi:5355_t:CDS:10 [Acaulospora colombiana]|uniref:5355_t:CDS:1 n=1 Tax=Acaulospora colombiana TaxID=27376 RepID=A0ACA9K591_9GLOM|nr:5355_t:CDS:10 [Acaulospora colombiana]
MTISDLFFRRDPSTLESISSALYGLSSYLPTSLVSLRKATITDPHPSINYHADYISHQFSGDADSPLHQVSDGPFEKKKDVIVYSAFDEIILVNSVNSSGPISQSVLVLGYPDGFQIWNVSSLDNIHELVSIRNEDKIGQVTCIKVIPIPRNTSKDARDKYAEVRPLVGVVCIPTSPRENGQQDSFVKPKAVLKFYSLKTHQIVKQLDFENEGTIVGVNCNERAIVVSLVNPARLHIISPLTLVPLFPSPLQDVAINSSVRIPVFALGSRLLAYATTSHPPEIKKDSYTTGDGDGMVGTTGKYQEVAKGVAKEVVNGVKLLGDLGFQTLSSYFANSSQSLAVKTQSTMPINIQNHTGAMSPNSRGSFSPQPSPSNGFYYNSRVGSVSSSSGESGNGLTVGNNGFESDKENGAVGAIIIRDLGTSCSVQKHQPPVVAHFAPHTHPVGHLSFNPSGKFLFSTSVQGHQFHVFEILGKRRSGNNKLRHVYKLSRGYTDAIVSEGGVGWSRDSRWCAVASGRGTVHVFAVNPYGGPAHVPSHISGWVKNVDEPCNTTTQSPVVRIKPRTPLPDSNDASLSQGSNIYPNVHDYYSYPPENNAPTTNDQSRRSSQLAYHNNSTNYHSHHVNGSLHPTLPIFCLRKSPGICVKFLPSLPNTSKSGLNSGNGLLTPDLYAKRQAKRRSSPSINIEGAGSTGSSNLGLAVRRRTRSWSQNSIAGVNNPSRSDYLDVEQDSKTDDIGCQDILSFHPSGILTLHRVWMEGVVVGEQTSRQGKEEINNKNLISMAGTPLAGSAAAVANVGRVIVGGAAGVVGGITGAVKKEAGSLDMVINYEDVAEWQVMRNASCDEVKTVIESQKFSDGETLVNRDSSNKWLANAEIETHTSSKTSLPPPLWVTPQFTFQTFLPGYKNALIKGETPRSKKIEIRRDVVERVEFVDEGKGIDGWIDNKENVNSHNVSKTKAVLVPAGKAIGKGMGDISENLSTAMRTSLDFVPPSPTLSAISTKSRDRMSNGFTNGYNIHSTASDMAITPLSFEDAYHIHIANNIPNTASSQSQPSLPSSKSLKHNSIKNNIPVGFSPLSSSTTASDSAVIHLPFTRSISSSSLSSEKTYSDDLDFSKSMDNEKEDACEDGNFFFSPDGDNEVETPSDSVIELLHDDKHINEWI